MSSLPATPRAAVFLSYAREDSESARRIADALRAFGVEVWFDQSELRGGDAWDAQIKKQIRECALFLPIVSARTQDRHEGYFRREWKLAVERTHDMAAGVAFIVPVVVDDTAEAEASVPEEFMRVQWTRLPHGVPSPQFVEQVKRLLTAPRKVLRDGSTGIATAARVGSRKNGAGNRNRVLGITGTVAVIAIGAATYVAFRPRLDQVAHTSDPKPKTRDAEPSSLVTAKSIAVLPFDNRSTEPDSTFFTDGIHEDILTNLALIRELRVVSRTSVAQYRGTKKTIPEIGQELGVAYVLEGSVQRAGNRVRVTGQLINARTDEHVWAKSYDKDLTDVFAIQSELAQAIAAALKAVLSPQEKKLLERRPTENLAAYDLYLKARELHRNPRAGASIDRQITLLQAAVDLDPNFSAAWAQLCYAHGWIYFFDRDHSAERKVKARAAMEEAVRIAPDSPESLRASADYSYYCLGDFVRAAGQYGAIVERQPNFSDAHQFLFALYRRQGKWLESIAAGRKVAELDPGNHFTVSLLGHTLVAARRYDEARAMYQRVARERPDDIASQFSLARTSFSATGSQREVSAMIAGLSEAQSATVVGNAVRMRWAFLTGNLNELLALAEKRAAMGVSEEEFFGPRSAGTDALELTVPIALMANGRTMEARARLPRVEPLRAQVEAQPENTLWRIQLSVVEALLGNHEAALRHARKAVELRPESIDAYYGAHCSENRAFVLAWTGDKDRAIAEYARLLRHPGAGLNIHEMKLDPRYQPLRGDPRFEALLADPKNNQPLF